MFSQACVCSVGGGGGGVLSQSQVVSQVSGPMSFLGGGVSVLAWGGGYPNPGPVGYTRTGVLPWPGQDGVPLGQVSIGYPPGQVRMGQPPSQVRMASQARKRYPPSPPHPQRNKQQIEYLLRGGRYASCVHAGGLSCSYYYFTLYITLPKRN